MFSCFGKSELSYFFFASQEEDVDEFYNGSGITWKLSELEARAIAGLRM